MLYRLVSTRVHLGDFCLFTQTRSLPEGFTPLTMHVRHEDVQACEQGPSAFLLYTLILHQDVSSEETVRTCGPNNDQRSL